MRPRRSATATTTTTTKTKKKKPTSAVDRSLKDPARRAMTDEAEAS
ncbi:MAG TPA: hypothetical protein VGF99_20920 [Myxococcota bacterium]